MMMITLTKSMLLDKEPPVFLLLPCLPNLPFRTHTHRERTLVKNTTREAYRPIDIAERQKLFWKKQKHTNNYH